MSLWSPVDNANAVTATTEAVQRNAIRQSPTTTLRERARLAANNAARDAYTEAFRLLASERGGVTATTRPGIEAEAHLAAREARRASYLSNGYGLCGNNASCGNLTTPGYTLCPSCSNT
jgi:hypothetical protein